MQSSEREKVLHHARSFHELHRQTAAQSIRALPAEEMKDFCLILAQDSSHGAQSLALELIPELLDPDFAKRLLDQAQGSEASPGLLQVVLLSLTRWEALPDELSSQLTQLCVELSDCDNDDLRYQALAARERSEEDSPEYRQLLIEALRDPDDEVRIIAAQGLARMGVKQAIPELEDALERAILGEQLHHLLALAQLGVGELWPHFERALGRSDERFAVILAIGDHQIKEGNLALLKIAKAWLGEPLSKVAAARSAALNGEVEALALLDRFTHARRPEVRDYALECLALVHQRQPELLSREGLEARIAELQSAKRQPDPDLVAEILDQRFS